MSGFGRFLSLAALLVNGLGCFAQSQIGPARLPGKQISQAQWFMRGRTLRGKSSSALNLRAQQQKLALRTARARGSAAMLQNLPTSGWISLGPAPLVSDASGVGFQDYGWVSGRATAVAIDPADTAGNTVYVGGAYGGLWRSQNATSGTFGNASSVTWQPLIDNQPTLSVGAIAFQPGNASGNLSKLILVGTGEADSSIDSYYGLGILRSIDSGKSWTLIGTADGGALGTLALAGLGATQMAFSTTQTSTVVAAMGTSSVGLDDGLVTGGTQRGLYTSTNAGQSWTFQIPHDPLGAISPTTSAAAVVYNAAAGKFYAAIRYHGFYSSADGLSWTRLANQPGGALLSTLACPLNYQSAVVLCPIYRGEISVVPGRNEMYVWFVDANSADQGIYRSADGGNTWTQIVESGLTDCSGPAPNPQNEIGCGTSQGTYNLALAAAPNGSATDLYAGAVNTYKCTLTTTTSTTCSQGTWLNLTHAFGCSNPGLPAHVHPDQHEITSIVVNGKDVLYFANDGGAYRALDGYLGLNTASCSGTNQFDSLNETLGSMTQLIWFSQHPTDPNTILAGAQGNGSPATASSQSSSQWKTINSGDGGYNAINPTNPVEWFTSNTGVSIQRCTGGNGCVASAFFPVVTEDTLAGDGGGFYTPYQLDPQNPGEMIVGTCRIWRGLSSGASFSAVSNDFEPGGVPPCSGNETNLVRSIAVGGPADSNGYSNVIYAGTDGFGPGTVPAGGHIWVTTNAAGGASSWMDRTGAINASGFPISSITIDTSDVTGQTAYATVMGFHVSHVWKTTSAGQTWTDFTGSLPDAPANAVVVDSAAAMVYVGTDVGVFGSSTTSATWVEVGPAPGSGQTGYLPDVPVTALKLFNSGGTKKLRASTYGRGLWEYPLVLGPDFQFTVPNPTQTIFPTQQAVFSGTITALNGYTSTVALSCSGKVPTTCTATPASVTPTVSGAAFTVTVSDTIGDYPFSIHGVGTDSNKTTHDAPVTLHVVDFGVTAPNPSAVTVNRPNTSSAIALQVTAAGSFSGTVTLSCSGLPAGAGCNFFPDPVLPTASVPVKVALTITTATTTPPGTYAINITGDAPGAPSPKTQPLSLTVTSNADYGLTISNPLISVIVGTNAAFDGTLTAYNGYSSLVDLSCGAGGPPVCDISPASVTPTAVGVPFTVTASSNAVQSYNFSVVAKGRDAANISHSTAVSLATSFDYLITNNSGAQSVAAGQAAAFSLEFSPAGGRFPATVSLACVGTPLRSTASFNPSQIAAGTGQTTVLLTVSTTAPITAMASGNEQLLLLASLLPLLGLALVSMRPGFVSARVGRGSALFLLVGCMFIELSCGGGGGGTPAAGSGQPGTPPGTYTLTATGTTTGVTHTVNLRLIVQ